MIIDTFNKKAENYKETDFRYARSNGPFIDMKIKELFFSWGKYLKPYIEYLKIDQEKLTKIPLGSQIVSDNENVKSKSILTKKRSF